MARGDASRERAELARAASDSAVLGDAVPGAAAAAVPEPAAELVANDVDTPIPSIPPPPVAGPWRSYKEIVATLSQRIVDAQRPIRVLNSLRWDPTIFDKFRASRFKDVPVVGPEHYAGVDLGFDPKQKAVEFEEIAREVARELPNDELGQILTTTAIEYRDVVRMLDAIAHA